jgi:hypothetical protein
VESRRILPSTRTTGTNAWAEVGGGPLVAVGALVLAAPGAVLWDERGCAMAPGCGPARGMVADESTAGPNRMLPHMLWLVDG